MGNQYSPRSARKRHFPSGDGAGLPSADFAGGRRRIRASLHIFARRVCVGETSAWLRDWAIQEESPLPPTQPTNALNRRSS